MASMATSHKSHTPHARRLLRVAVCLVVLSADVSALHAAPGWSAARCGGVRVAPPIATLAETASADQPQKVSYGVDPRITMGDSVDEDWGGAPDPGTMGELTGVRELSSALLTAQESSKLVVIKFFAPWCSSCKSIEARFARTARATEEADFYFVDFSKSKAFCKACGIKFMPVAHIYSAGELLEAMPIGAKAFPKFVKRMGDAVSELGAGAAPEGGDGEAEEDASAEGE